jgi:hypothetical protein
MTKKKLTWGEKLRDSKGHPTIIDTSGQKSQRWGSGTMVIPAPMEVDEIMRTVRKGELITIDEIRQQLAAKHRTNTACPITTGIFAWIAAHAADEAEQQGKKPVTPYWRTLKKGGELNAKYPGGIENIQVRLEAEGHTVVQRRQRYFVEPSTGAVRP